MFIKKSGLAVLLSLVTSSLFAGTFTNYATGDVLLCFRKTGVANDLVVNLGPVSIFTNLTANQRYTITNYTGAQLSLVATNGVSWSAFAWYDLTVTPASRQWTLFASNPRSSLDTQTDPIPQDKQNAQHLVGNQMSPIPFGALDNLNHSPNALSTSVAVIEPDNNNSSTYTSGQSYSFSIGPNFNFNDTFGGFPENTTAGGFTTSGMVQRSDFYLVPPSSIGGVPTGLSDVFLGYFELNTNGVMTYVAYPSGAVAVPVIQSVSRTNNISYIKFTTGSFGTYTLRGTNSAGLSANRTTWPAITTSPGTGSPVTLQDATSSSNKFYTISAQ